MDVMAQNLPQMPNVPMSPHDQYATSQMPGMQTTYGPQPMPYQPYSAHRMDPNAIVRSQQMQQVPYAHQQYGHQQSGNQAMLQMQQMQQMQLQGQYNMVNYYGYGGMRPPQTVNQAYGQMGSSGMRTTSSDYPRQSGSSGGAPIPMYPRGPPRKPKQSGHALWVGNLPPNAQIADLKDHFSRDATADIESLFLISKSNCAFVNYRSAKACSDAMTRFHDSRFHGVRLVCRLRRGSATDTVSGTADESVNENRQETAASSTGDESPTKDEEHETPSDPHSPTIVSGSYTSLVGSAEAASASQSQSAHRVPEKYFIVKSLTVQDLESSIRTGIWATQSHNETVLNDAYQNADNVYLIFSANKSGEYFGYARMASNISSQPVNLSTGASQTETPHTGTPQAIETPPTFTAPRGRIIDDSARGTIFWEAIPAGDDKNDAQVRSSASDAGSSTGGANWGRQFSIEWISTARLPFYRTRGLRNPWNSNREVKIARDGTELEPDIGRRLLQMFHRPPAGIGPHQGTMHYQ